jgi:hypothetical protein
VKKYISNEHDVLVPSIEEVKVVDEVKHVQQKWKIRKIILPIVITSFCSSHKPYKHNDRGNYSS